MKAKRVAASGLVEGPWALPDGWGWAELGTLGRWTGGGTPSKARSDFWSGGTIPWVSPKDMKRALIDSSEDAITNEAVAGSSAKLIPAGSLLCVMRSGILRHTFPVAVNTVDVTLNQDMRALTPSEGISPRYLAYYLQLTGQAVLQNASKAGTTVNSVEASRLDRHPVPLPQDQAMQDCIIARIDELFAEIHDGEAALARARADLATWRKALLKAAVTGELTADWRASRHIKATETDPLATEAAEDLPDLPQGWTWTTVGRLGRVSGGITKNAKRGSLDRQVSYLRVANVHANRLVLDRIETIGVTASEFVRTELQEGDLLIVEGNGSIDQIGRSAVWDGSIPSCVHQNHLIKVRFEAPLLPQWVQAWLQSPHGRRELEAKASSTSGLHTLSISKVQALRCPLPPMPEIDEALSQFNRLQDEAIAGEHDFQAARSDAAALRQSILSAAFRGELPA